MPRLKDEKNAQAGGAQSNDFRRPNADSLTERERFALAVEKVIPHYQTSEKDRQQGDYPHGTPDSPSEISRRRDLPPFAVCGIKNNHERQGQRSDEQHPESILCDIPYGARSFRKQIGAARLDVRALGVHAQIISPVASYLEQPRRQLVQNISTNFPNGGEGGQVLCGLISIAEGRGFPLESSPQLQA